VGKMEILGNLLLDICVVALLILMLIVGIKQGFFDSSFGIITTLISLGGGAGLAYLFCEYAIPKFGWEEGLTDSFISMLGGENTIFEKMGVTAKDLAGYLSYAVFFIVSLIVGYILVRILMYLITKLLVLCRYSVVFRITDSIIGVVVNVGLVLILVMLILGFFHAFEGSGLMVNIREFIKSTYVCKFLYESDLNFFSAIFEDLGIADTFKNIF
jgi:hypothetical protein